MPSRGCCGREQWKPVLCLVDQLLEFDPVVKAVLVPRVIGGKQRYDFGRTFRHGLMATLEKRPAFA
jgi:hypothetical protein